MQFNINSLRSAVNNFIQEHAPNRVVQALGQSLISFAEDYDRKRRELESLRFDFETLKQQVKKIKEAGR